MTLKCPPEKLLRDALRTFHNSSRIIQPVTRSQSTYRAAECVELGTPLVIKSRPCVTAIPDGHIKVKVKAAAINYSDVLSCRGEYQDKRITPFIPGSEVAGDVIQVANDVTKCKPGDRVFGVCPTQTPDNGAFAEEMLLPEIFVQMIPKSVSYTVASSVMVSYATAYLALTRKANIKPGQTVLVTAAAGATGLAIVDLAANVFNCQVIAACGSSEKFNVCLKAGAKHTVNYTTENLQERVKAITNGSGVDIVLDMVGGQVWEHCLKCAGFEAHLVVIGFASGSIPQVKTNYLLLKSCTVSGVWWGNYGARGNPLFMESIQAVNGLLETGRIQPVVSTTYALEQVNEAFEDILKRKTTGKVLLIP